MHDVALRPLGKEQVKEEVGITTTTRNRRGQTINGKVQVSWRGECPRECDYVRMMHMQTVVRYN